MTPLPLEVHEVVIALGKWVDHDGGVYQWLNREADNSSSPQWDVVEKIFPYSTTVTINQRFDSDMTRLFKEIAVAPVLIVCNGVQDYMTCHFRDEASAVQFSALMDVKAITTLEPYRGRTLYRFGVMR